MWMSVEDYKKIQLKANQLMLEALGKIFIGLDLEQIIYPNPISGPMNVVLRLEFSIFHLERHRQQIDSIKKHLDFPI